MSTKRRRRSLVVIAFALTSVPLAVAGPTTMKAFGEAPPASPYWHDPTGWTIPENWHDPADDLLPDPGPFLAQVSKLVGDARYAGGWIDRPADPAERDEVAWLRVAIVNPTDADRAAVAQLSHANAYISIVPATYSLSSLRTWRDDFVAYFIETKPGQAMVDDNEQTNRVVVHVQTTPPGLNAYLKLKGVPDDAWTLDNQVSPISQDHTTRTEGLPYEGGLQLDVYDGYQYWGCTAWFTTKTSTGVYKAATAGHCEHNTSDWGWIGDDPLGDGAMNSHLGQTRTSSDAVRYNLPSGQQTNRLMLAAGVHATVSNRYYISAGNEPVAGAPVCLLGAASGGGTCGFVYSADQPIQGSSGVWHDHSWLATYAGIGGDSGAPVYRTNPDGTKKAAGLHWGSNATHAFFHHVSLVLSDLDVNLYYG